MKTFKYRESTGKNDKHDNVIREGDILVGDETTRCTAEYIVEWNLEHACFTAIDGGFDNNYEDVNADNIQYYLLSNLRLNKIEIIGNIYDERRAR